MISALALSGTAAPAGTAGQAATVLPRLEQTLVAKVNAVRARYGLRRLSVSVPLTSAARLHTRQMLAGGYFAHGAVWRRITAYYPNPAAVGETMVWGQGALSAERAVALWMASPGHRKILLSPAWRLVGIGAVYEGAAGGIYGDRPATVVVADFSAP
jgi:uncharacterized protein YkwD